MIGDRVRIEVEARPQGERYRDKFVVEKVYGEHPEEYREEIWSGYKPELRDIVAEGQDCLDRHDRLKEA